MGLLNALLRRKEMIAICTLLVASAALLASLAQEPSYDATASVRVEATDGEPSPERVIEFARDDQVAQDTAGRVGGVSADFVSAQTLVSPGPAGTVKVEARSDTPEEAARMATAFAESFVDHANQLGDRFPGQAQLAEEAAIPADPTGPRSVRNTLLGALGGLLLGIVAALVRDRLDRYRQMRAHEAAVAEGAAVPLEAAREPARSGSASAPGPRRPGPPPTRRADPAVEMDAGSHRIDLNNATYDELRTLDLTITQAKRVLAYRERRGGFSSVDDIDDLPGFPDEVREELKRQVTVVP
jgi:capsular polysaccharide biosynthesis protein